MVTRLLLLQFACTTREPVDVGFNNVVKKKRKNKTKQKKRQVSLQEARFPYLTKSCLSLGYIYVWGGSRLEELANHCILLHAQRGFLAQLRSPEKENSNLIQIHFWQQEPT